MRLYHVIMVSVWIVTSGSSPSAHQGGGLHESLIARALTALEERNQKDVESYDCGYYYNYYNDGVSQDDRCRRTMKSEPCEGRGECVCGFCMCDQLTPTTTYSGAYCECDNYSCGYHNGRICGGGGHGVCMCGECRCRPGYTGYACHCTTDTQSCTDSNGVMCSRHGVCQCGQCNCDDEYHGRLCQLLVHP